MAALPQVAVQDGVQGHGIGSALVTEVIAAMAHLGFEMIHAHIRAHLVRWYAAGGMNVLQAGAGLAWVEMPGPGSEHLAPTDWTAEKRAADTPRLGIRPDGNGYDHIRFAQLAPLQKLIWATPYSTDGDLVHNAARTMLRLSLEVPVELFVARLSQGARDGLLTDGLTPPLELSDHRRALRELREMPLDMLIIAGPAVEPPAPESP